MKLEVPNPTVQGSSEAQRPPWKLPPVPPLGIGLVVRQAGRTGKRHAVVHMTPGANNKPVTFDWGPLPGTAPMDNIPFDLRSHKSKDNPAFVNPDVGDDREWDQEAEEDYERTDRGL